jgi:hypothetical protein
MSDTPDPPAEPHPWPEIIAFTREYVAKLREQAAFLRGRALFDPSGAEKDHKRAARLERMADAAEKSVK